MFKNLRTLAVVALLFTATSTFSSQLRDGGDPPPTCAPNEPNCKP